MMDTPFIGSSKAGPLGTIADVVGVSVGHCTLDEDAMRTGVTVARPHDGDVYRSKGPAAMRVINGFGKSIGPLQVDELGVLVTPIPAPACAPRPMKIWRGGMSILACATLGTG